MAPAPAAGTGAGFSDVPSQPQVNFLSIERAPPLRGAGRAGKYYRYAADPRACCASSRGGQWGLTNVRIIRTDAATFLANFIPDSFVDCFHIYFPDPWPKKRHHKRRLFCQANLEQLLRCLKTGGNLRIATDYPEYFELITELMEANKNQIEPTEFLPTAGAKDTKWVGTNFKRKYLKQQRPSFALL